MTTAPLRWGILGTGGIARTFLQDIHTYTDQRVVAIGSRNKETALAFAENYGVAAHGSYDEIVASDLDAIYVATPHPMHAPNTILALTHGKPVLCEKPFAVNARESAEMITAARRSSLLLLEAMWSRFLPHYRQLRDLIESGELGEIRVVEADHGQPLPARTHHRLHAPELAGGALLDLGIYPISLAFMILGRPDAITSAATFTPSGVDAMTSAIFEYSSGAQAVINTTLEAKSSCRASVVGTKARIEIDSDFYTPTSMRLIRSKSEIVEFPRNYQGHGLREQALEFERLLGEGKKESSILSLDESQAIMEVMDQIRSQISLRYPFEN